MKTWILSLALVLAAGAAGALPLLHSDDGTGNLNSIDRGLVVATDGGDVATIGSLGGGLASVGLAWDPSGGVLYGVDVVADQLLSIDVGSGAASVVGALGVDLDDAGLAWDSGTGTLYLSSGGLFSVDTGTGAASAIGSGFGVLSLSGLAYDPTRDALVGVDDSTTLDSRLWEIDRTTGLATALGATSLGVPVSGAGLAYDPDEDVFWITDDEVGVSDNFYVAPATGGAATRIGGLSQQTGSGGLAFVPEPGTACLLGLGLAGLAARRRRGAATGAALLAAAALLPAAPVEAATLVAPNGYETLEGDNGNSFPFNNFEGRYQQAYGADQFPTAPLLISEIAFRTDADPAAADWLSTLSFDLSLSTSANPVGSLSATFADNVGSDQSLVYTASAEAFSGSNAGAPGPNAFDLVILLDTPFLYDPGAGDLLLDVVMDTNTNLLPPGGFSYLDAVESTTGLFDVGLQRVWNSSDTAAATGNLDTEGYGLVTRFTYTPVPEPGTGLLVALGLAGAALERRRARRI